MEQLTEIDVKHVANLARLAIKEDELAHYCVQLNDILSEINKILEAPTKEESIMISPCIEEAILMPDEAKELLTKEEVLANASNHNEDYIIVPKVIL